jgi:DNA-binding CsgD family transcriptional regulator/Tfp pilus assembly protein PilF
MLEPIRQYAQEKLEETGEAKEVQVRHAEFFLDLAEEAEPELAGPQQGLWVERLEGEHDNLREAFSWALEGRQAELALRFGGMLWRFWAARGYLREGARWLERALAAGEQAPAQVRVKPLEGLGWLVQRQGNYGSAKATYEELLKLSQELGDKGNVATALNSLGTMAAQQGDYDRARALLEENLAVLGQMEDERDTATTLKRYHVVGLLGFLAINGAGGPTRAAELFEQSVALAREAGDVLRLGVGLTCLAFPALLEGEYQRARSLCEEALALARDLGSAGGDIVPEALINRGLAAVYQDDHEYAKASFEEALATSQNLGRTSSVINALEGLASLAGASGENVRAAHLWGSAEAARKATGIALPSSDRALHEPYLAAARSQLREEAWEEALANGSKMTLEEGVEYILAKKELAAPASAAPEQPSASAQMSVALTPREKEVAFLATQELTNRQIAAQLMLSEHTVAAHVRNVLKKLGLYSRNQITDWFAEHQPQP